MKKKGSNRDKEKPTDKESSAESNKKMKISEALSAVVNEDEQNESDSSGYES